MLGNPLNPANPMNMVNPVSPWYHVWNDDSQADPVKEAGKQAVHAAASGDAETAAVFALFGLIAAIFVFMCWAVYSAWKL